jgi:hypothetical protein
MYSEVDNEQALRAGYFMGLAIDKAHRCSPWIGIGCVVTTSADRLIQTGAQRLGEQRHLLNVLYDKIHETNTTAYLTQEPYLLSELAERELLGLLPSFGVGQIHIAQLAPGRFAGRWCSILKNNGIKVDVGTGRLRVGLPARVGEKLVISGRPWITAVLFLDEKERSVLCKSFERDFGFEADLARLTCGHSLLLSTRTKMGFSEFVKERLRKRLMVLSPEPTIVNLQHDLASEDGYRELLDIQSSHKMAAMLLPTLPATFLALDERGMVDELVVYQSGKNTAEEGKAHLVMVPGDGRWHLQDYSPLGDSHRFVYRTVTVEHNLTLH